MLFRSVALVLLAAPAVLGFYEPCKVNGRAGGCFDPGVCRSGGGTPVRGHCPGGSNNVCCLKKCDYNGDGYAGGSCRMTSDCPHGQYVSNKCPGPPAFKCCNWN